MRRLFRTGIPACPWKHIAARLNFCGEASKGYGIGQPVRQRLFRIVAASRFLWEIPNQQAAFREVYGGKTAFVREE